MKFTVLPSFPGQAKGKEVTTELFYLTQNLKVLSITKDLTGSGEVSFNFAFPKPTKGWPPGDYRLVIFTIGRGHQGGDFSGKINRDPLTIPLIPPQDKLASFFLRVRAAGVGAGSPGGNSGRA